MNELSHRQARRLIQQSDRSSNEQVLLARHLQTCEECAGYAQVHKLLSRQLAVAPVRSYPRPAERARILARAGQRSPWFRLKQNLATAGVLAALALIVLGAWYLLQFQAPGRIPNTAATIVAPPAPRVTPAPTVLPTPTATPEPTPEQPAIRWETRNVPAPSLANSMVGEPAEQPVIVFLPPSYDTSARRYPVLFLLPGEDEGPNNPVTTEVPTIVAALTLLLREGHIQEMILVVPNGQNVIGLESYYVNSAVNGNWEDFIVHDVVAYVDSQYRTLPERKYRGLTGSAMGGFGAVNLGFRHPDLFGAVYAVNPSLLTEGGLEKSPYVSNNARHDVTALIEELSGLSRTEAHARYLDYLKSHRRRWDLTLAFSYGQAFAANPGRKAPYFDYAYQDAEVQATDEIWRQWEDGLGDIPGKVAAYSQRQPQLDAIAMAYDTSYSYQWAKDGVEALADELSQAGIPFTMNKHQGIPGFVDKLSNDVLPFFSEYFGSNQE